MTPNEEIKLQKTQLWRHFSDGHHHYVTE